VLGAEKRRGSICCVVIFRRLLVLDACVNAPMITAADTTFDREEKCIIEHKMTNPGRFAL
jgi:hypothetical protein